MGTCNNRQPNHSSKTARGRGCTRKLDALTDRNGSCTANTPAKKQRTEVALAATSSSRPEELLKADKTPTISELNIRAMALWRQGDFDTAAALFRRAISMRMKFSERVKQQTASSDDAKPSAENSTTIKSRSNTEATEADPVANITCNGVPPASCYIYQRTDFDEGLNVYSEPWPLPSDENPEVEEATLLFNAGQARRKLNDMKGARICFDQALRVFLPLADKSANITKAAFLVVEMQTDYDIIIPLLHAVGQLAYRNGQLDDAFTIYQSVLKHSRRIETNHLATGRTLNCLGVICYHLSSDKSEMAKQCFEEALEIQSTFQVNSLEVATTFNNLGRVFVQKEEFRTALGHYEKALAIRKSLGEDHIDYAATAFNAGQSLHQLGQFDQALTLYQVFLRVAVRRFSRQHRDVAVVLSGIAQIYQEKKDFEQALALYEESLEVGRAALGNSHSEIAMLLNRLGNFHFDRGNFVQALTSYEEGLEIERQVLEETHPNIIVTLSNIAEIHKSRNDFDNAIRLYQEALKLQKQCYGLSSTEVATTLNVLGLIYDLRGSANMALSCLQEALVIRRSVLGDNHLDVSATLTYLGAIFYRRGSTFMSLQLFNEALRIRIDALGKYNREVSFTLYNVGLCHFQVGNYSAAISMWDETLRIEQAVLGQNHKDVAMTLFKLGEALFANREFEKALDCYAEALKIEQGNKENADPKSVAKIWNEIGNVHLAMGNKGCMMSAFIEAARVLQRSGLLQHDSLSLPGQIYAFDASFPSSAPSA